MYQHTLPTLSQSNGLLVAAAVLSVGLASSALSDTGANADRKASVAGGTVVGHVINGVLAFKGIPFAAPPVGAFRWRAPQSVVPWAGILDAKDFSNDCMQQSDYSGSNVGIPPLRTEPSEDCLYLNVLRPEKRADHLLPVMIWFFGGGFSTGGTSAVLFAGDSFPKQGVIFVSFNYRLGRFGFFGHPALSREHPEEPKANYGFLDQIAALKWVKQNIAAFGGDASNVTIFGESAGGGSVDAMIVSPLARGLFQKAIIESGPDHGLTKRELHSDQPGRLSLEKFGLAFAASRGISGTNLDSLERLRALPAQDLTDLSSGLPPGIDQSRTPWGGPTMDGQVLPIVKGDYFRLGKFTSVPIIIGANSDDITPSSGALDDKPLDNTLARFGTQQSRALRIYDPEGTGSAKQIRRRVAADDHMIEPARYIATEVAKHGATVYRYYFSYVTQAMEDQWKFGAPHGAEISYAFNNLRYYYGPASTDRDMRVSKMMINYWVNFAKSGNPNGGDLPEWPHYDPASDVILEFHKDGHAEAEVDPLKARLDLAAGISEPTRNAAGLGPGGEDISRLPKWPFFEPTN